MPHQGSGGCSLFFLNCKIYAREGAQKARALQSLGHAANRACCQLVAQHAIRPCCLLFRLSTAFSDHVVCCADLQAAHRQSNWFCCISCKQHIVRVCLCHCTDCKQHEAGSPSPVQSSSLCNSEGRHSLLDIASNLCQLCNTRQACPLSPIPPNCSTFPSAGSCLFSPSSQAKCNRLACTCIANSRTTCHACMFQNLDTVLQWLLG